MLTEEQKYAVNMFFKKVFTLFTLPYLVMCLWNWIIVPYLKFGEVCESYSKFLIIYVSFNIITSLRNLGRSPNTVFNDVPWTSIVGLEVILFLILHFFK